MPFGPSVLKGFTKAIVGVALAAHLGLLILFVIPSLTRISTILRFESSECHYALLAWQNRRGATFAVLRIQGAQSSSTRSIR